jgi:integral membrane sensor domain MASE1
LTQLFAGGQKFYEQPGNVLKFALLAAGVSPLLGPPIILAETYSGFASLLQPVDQLWLLCWLADVVSILVFTPFLVSWSAEPRVNWSRAEAVEFTVLFTLLTVVAGMVFGNLAPAPATHFLLPYLCLPFLQWAAFRFPPARLRPRRTARSTCRPLLRS